MFTFAFATEVNQEQNKYSDWQLIGQFHVISNPRLDPILKEKSVLSVKGLTRSTYDNEIWMAEYWTHVKLLKLKTVLCFFKRICLFLLNRP